jgi:hypothetical protein
VLGGTPATAATAAVSPGTDAVEASLLGTEDLPGFFGRDLEDPTELDIDRLAFDEHRGIRVSTRAWVSDAQGVVFDQRMLFPTDAAALAYLVAAEPTLAEADDAGLALVSDEPLTPATRHWAGEAIIGAEPVAMDVWLIPVGPVVAKVSATLFGPGLELRRVIAERALARLEAAFGPADALWPSGSPGLPSPAPSSALEAIQRLVQQVLLVGLRGCVGIDPGLAGEITALSCARDGATIVYRLFTDAETRDAALASLLEQAHAPDSSARSCAEGPFQGVVTEPGRTWSVACWVSSAGPVLLWTEPDEPVLGAILAPEATDPMVIWEQVRLPV